MVRSSPEVEEVRVVRGTVARGTSQLWRGGGEG